MYHTIPAIVKGMKDWHSQVFHLALIDLQKTAHGTALGWVWLFVKPAMYIGCFYFALFLGIKAGGHMDGGEYIIWLSAGIIRWFFLQSMLGGGSDVFKKYKYLDNKLSFPVVLIPVFYELSGMLLHLMLLACLMVGYFIGGGPLDVYLLQLPLVVVLMYLFSVGWSLMISPLSAISRDVKNLIKALSTPIFWLSGVLFDITSIHSTLVQTVALFNPVTFLTSCYRKIFTVPGATVVKDWIWSDPTFFWCGIGVILLTIACGCFVFAKLRKDIPDVL